MKNPKGADLLLGRPVLAPTWFHRRRPQNPLSSAFPLRFSFSLWALRPLSSPCAQPSAGSRNLPGTELKSQESSSPQTSGSLWGAGSSDSLATQHLCNGMKKPPGPRALNLPSSKWKSQAMDEGGWREKNKFDSVWIQKEFFPIHSVLPHVRVSQCWGPRPGVMSNK